MPVDTQCRVSCVPPGLRMHMHTHPHGRCNFSPRGMHIPRRSQAEQFRTNGRDHRLLGNFTANVSTPVHPLCIRIPWIPARRPHNGPRWRLFARVWGTVRPGSLWFPSQVVPDPEFFTRFALIYTRFPRVTGLLGEVEARGSFEGVADASGEPWILFKGDACDSALRFSGCSIFFPFFSFMRWFSLGR